MFRDARKACARQPRRPQACLGQVGRLCAGGAKAVADALFALAGEGEKLFDDDIVTDYPRKLAIADSIREVPCEAPSSCRTSWACS